MLSGANSQVLRLKVWGVADRSVAGIGVVMVADIDIWRSAEQMRKLYGEDASTHATMRADKALDQGDTEGFAVWKRITKAAEELARQKPSASEPLN